MAQVFGFIKGKSAIHIARTFVGRKRNFTGQILWARGYFVSTVRADEEAAERGGSNGARVRLWKTELQKFSTESGLVISVCHFPPGPSKWNKSKNPLLSFISQNWRGKPLISHEVIVNLLAATTTRTGVQIRCDMDYNSYPVGVKVSDKDLKAVNLIKDDFHGEWNHTTKPNRT